MLKRLSLLLLLGLFSGQLFSQELILTSPPRENRQKGEAQYGPLAEYLGTLLGKPVKYVHPGNWLNYQREMRADKYDIVFDGPHFAAWRVAHLGNQVVIKLPGNLQFYLLVRKDGDIHSLNDLIGKKICGISPPNLSTLSILAAFDNPVRQPIIKGIKGGMGKVNKAFLMEGKCSAMVLRSAFYKKKLKPEQKQQLRIIYESERMPNQVITASKRISLAEVEKMRQGLLHTRAGNQALAATLKRFGGKAKNFVVATNREYDGYNTLLEGVIFGW